MIGIKVLLVEEGFFSVGRDVFSVESPEAHILSETVGEVTSFSLESMDVEDSVC